MKLIFFISLGFTLIQTTSYSQDKKIALNYLSSEGLPNDSSIIDSQKIFLSHNNFKICYYHITDSKNLMLPSPSIGGYYFFFRNSKLIAELKLEHMILIKQRIIKDDTEYYFGAYEITEQGHGLFKVIRYKGDSAKCVFTTEDKVYNNNSSDCYNICNGGFLKLSLKDLNNDGIPDFSFTGQICVYCKGLENGFGSSNRKPLKKVRIKYTYVSSIDSNNKIHWIKNNKLSSNANGISRL
jgi:hypothetical protein